MNFVEMRYSNLFFCSKDCLNSFRELHEIKKEEYENVKIRYA